MSNKNIHKNFRDSTKFEYFFPLAFFSDDIAFAFFISALKVG